MSSLAIYSKFNLQVKMVLIQTHRWRINGYWSTTGSLRSFWLSPYSNSAIMELIIGQCLEYLQNVRVFFFLANSISIVCFFGVQHEWPPSSHPHFTIVHCSARETSGEQAFRKGWIRGCCYDDRNSSHSRIFIVRSQLSLSPREALVSLHTPGDLMGDADDTALERLT